MIFKSGPKYFDTGTNSTYEKVYSILETKR